MENASYSAQTTARATASLASTRSVLKRLNAQRTALLTHEAAVLVHSIAVQNLVDYPAAATITFSSNHPLPDHGARAGRQSHGTRRAFDAQFEICPLCGTD